MLLFQLLTCLIAVLGIWGIYKALFIYRDVFHPLAYLMPMAIYLYVYLPYDLAVRDLIALVPFTGNQWAAVQFLNLVCLGALVAGCLMGSAGLPKRTRRKIPLTPGHYESAYRFALFLGGVSLLAYAANLNNVGGFLEAYSREKGGGTAESGYLRDAIFWSIPAITLLCFCMSWDGVQPKFWIPMLLFALPMLFHGLLGARRGPTFLIVVTLVASWYLARRDRPAKLVFLGGGLALGLLLLLIVNFREEFRLGGKVTTETGSSIGTMIEELDDRQLESAERNLGGNEFVYGTNVILTFGQRHDYYWGTRLLTIIFIRPIPKQIWPTKYEDVGMERYTVNVGLGTGEDMVMWTTYGAAPGFIADFFAEFSYGVVLICGLIGFAYGKLWRLAVTKRGLGMVLYVLLFALSIYLVLQTMEAIVFRFAFTSFPVLLFWYFFMRPKKEPQAVAKDTRTRESRSTRMPAHS